MIQSIAFRQIPRFNSRTERDNESIDHLLYKRGITKLNKGHEKVARTYPTRFYSCQMGKRATYSSRESPFTRFQCHPSAVIHGSLLRIASKRFIISSCADEYFANQSHYQGSRRHISRTESRSSSWIEALNSSSKELSNELSTDKIYVGLHPEISTPT